MVNQNSSPQPNPGDLIEITRGNFQHWAMYVGDGYVIHLTTGSNAVSSFGSSSCTANGEVRRQLLSEVAGNDHYCINNNSDTKWKPLPVDQMIENATAKVGTQMEYKITTANCEHFVNELRYGKKESFQSSPQPNPGDLIEITRGNFQHWAMYVGDGYVIHLTTGSNAVSSFGSSSCTANGEVRRQLLSEVAGNDHYRINNNSDTKWKPLPVDQMIENATAKVGTQMEYKITTANCEHFVNELRYGKKESFQVKKLLYGVPVASFAAAVCAGGAVVVAPVSAAAAVGAAAGVAAGALIKQFFAS
ncbi:phospholipase A and acyltransferase 1-like [Heterodontus francisci]|uniref:phospholipase A and acyltransferase 1-like n=1 Tax=Heterodontus francisci TaxID=7792 RepID=UPI00355BC58E